MNQNLKEIHDQTIVITGATSKIGFATARAAARLGARVVLAGQNETDLHQLEVKIIAAGGKASIVVGDCEDADDIQRIADMAMSRFGSIDTWILDSEISLDNGAREAVKYMQEGGTVINLGKEAEVKFMTDTFQSELKKSKSPISVSWISNEDSPEDISAEILKNAVPAVREEGLGWMFYAAAGTLGALAVLAVMKLKRTGVR